MRVGFLSRRIWAQFALKRLLTGVDLFVGVQTTFVIVPILPTYLTTKISCFVKSSILLFKIIFLVVAEASE